MRHLILTMVLAGVAQAQQPPPDQLAQAKREFEWASTEFNLGHYEQALVHFENSYRLSGRPALLYNLGYVNKQLFERSRRLDRLELAIERWETFLSSTAQDADPKVQALRPKVEKELEEARRELTREKSARARGKELLEVAADLLAHGQVAEAEAQLDKYVQSGLERDGIAAAWLLAGSVLIAKGESGTNAYARALSLDRTLHLPANAPAAAKQAFTEAQAKLGPSPPFAISHAPPGSLKPAAPVELTFTLTSDPMALAKGMALHYRAGSGAFSTLKLPVGKVKLPVTFSSALQPGQKVEYYAEVVDGLGNVLEHLGSPVLPFSVTVETPRGPGVAKKWWFWTVTGVLVAGAAVGIGLGVHYSQPAPPQQIHVGDFSLLHF
jgi:tetratricopeptide (TPR) repeat protein